MITDWRGKTLDVGDLVIFTRGTSNRHFAIGKILSIVPNYHANSSWIRPESGLMLEIVEESGWKNTTKRPSKVLLSNVTKIQ